MNVYKLFNLHAMTSAKTVTAACIAAELPLPGRDQLTDRQTISTNAVA